MRLSPAAMIFGVRGFFSSRRKAEASQDISIRVEEDHLPDVEASLELAAVH